jgi:fucose 4-O-acetylase-like acetyltransferase
MTATIHAPAPISGQQWPKRIEQKFDSRGRDPFLDNAKMILVTLVVVGHFWELVRLTALNGALYDFLYLFHVPAFVMVTGYLSRSFRYTRRHLGRLVTTVLVPYLVFETALAWFRTSVGGEQLENLYVDPHWPMWYLAALLLWRLTVPVLTGLRWRAALVVAVAVSLLGGLSTADTLDTARMMGLLPFFVLGVHARPEHLALLRRPATRVAGALALLVALPAAFLLSPRASTEWIYWRASYDELGVGFLQGAGIRLVLLVACGALALAALSLVPTSRTRFTALGSASLVVYLFHGFAVKAADYAGVADLAAAWPAATLALLTAAAIGLGVLLAVPPVSQRLGAVVDPVGALRRAWAPRRAGIDDEVVEPLELDRWQVVCLELRRAA